MNTLEAMAQALLDPAAEAPDGLRTWNGSDPAVRLAVYRNNVFASLIAALAETFPVTRALLGVSDFHALARTYVRVSPPALPMLVDYGGTFPDFLAECLVPAAGEPVAALARFEWQYVEAFHAEDATPIDARRLAECLGDPGRLEQVRLILHPSLRLSHARHPVAALWARWQAESALPASADRLEPMPEHVMLLRPATVVEVTTLVPATAGFIESLRQGMTLGAAVNRALAELPGFNPVEALALLVRAQAIVDLCYQGDL